MFSLIYCSVSQPVFAPRNFFIDNIFWASHKNKLIPTFDFKQDWFKIVKHLCSSRGQALQSWLTHVSGQLEVLGLNLSEESVMCPFLN